MAGPYTIGTPVQGQPASSSLFALPVKAAIEDLHLRAAALENNAQVIVARGQRTTAKSVAAGSAGTETPFLRVDDIPVKAGAGYRIMTSSANIIGSVANDTMIAQVRVQYAATPGTLAVTGTSPQLTNIRQVQEKAGSSDSESVPMSGFYFATADGFISVLVSFRRTAGTGTTQMYAAAGEVFDLTIEYAGPVPSNLGIIL